MTNYDDLIDFVMNRMRMSHIYQPVMLLELLRSDGSASVERIATAFAANDRSQIEYYRKIVNAMPGRVLRSHDIVEKDGDGYLLPGFPDLGDEQRADLIRLCEARLDDFVAQRGEEIWSHRSRTSGYISGSIRYEVLKGARFRCELCGVPADQRFLEVDHIVPRSRGGTDDLTNLQALCYRCNQIKGNRDDVDLRNSDAIYEHREVGCPFCEGIADRVIDENLLAFVIRDGYPVTPLHTLVIPKRHVASYFDLTRPETIAIDQLAQQARASIQETDPTVEGFNLGVNDGTAAGQTVAHVHLHLIPRYEGDVDDPRGGIRWIIPTKAAYWNK
jgi:ATP adenylyltransferase